MSLCLLLVLRRRSIKCLLGPFYCAYYSVFSSWQKLTNGLCQKVESWLWSMWQVLNINWVSSTMRIVLISSMGRNAAMKCGAERQVLTLLPRLECSGGSMSHCNLDFPVSSDPPPSAYRVAGTIGTHHHMWLILKCW
nr:uncharacterized protein LOC129528220 isoform X1 [Gorilla gorilla gorilla]